MNYQVKKSAGGISKFIKSFFFSPYKDVQLEKHPLGGGGERKKISL